MTYQWGEHVGELELRLEGADDHEVFREAVRACAELLAPDEGGPDATQPLERFAIEASGADRGSLLAGWIDEIAFLAESEGVVPVAVEELEADGGSVRGRIAGYRGDPPHLIKAVTYHGLAFERRDGGWRARVIIDV